MTGWVPVSNAISAARLHFKKERETDRHRQRERERDRHRERERRRRERDRQYDRETVPPSRHSHRGGL
jgi:hypothetical protein